MFLLHTTENRGHKHVAFQRDDETGITSTDHDHFHQIVIDERPVDVGGLSSAQLLEAADTGIGPTETVVVLTSVDGHTHELTEDIITSDPEELKEDTENDEVLIVDSRGLWQFAKGQEEDFRTKGIESEGFYDGTGQWNKAEKKTLKNAKRAALTINETAGKIDQLSGFHRQNRLDITYFPVGNGDGRVADMVTAIVKNLLNKNDFLHEENQVFEDKMIVGRGFYHTYMDYDKNILGDLIVDQFPWDGAWLGPHQHYDLSDCEYQVRSQWYSFARLKEMYPDAAENLTRDYEGQFGTEDGVERPIQEDKGREYELAMRNLPIKHGVDFFDITSKEYRVLQVDRKVYKKLVVLVNAKEDFYFNAEGVNAADIKAVETIPGFRSIPRVETSIKTIIFAGAVMLDKQVDQGEDTFSLTVDYAKKRGTRVWGKVESAKDSQREINKRTSQSIDIMNTAAGYGWFWDDQTFLEPRDEKNFRKNAGTPGFTAKVKDTARPPVKVEGTKFPNEVVQLQILARESLERVMNSPPELQGRSQRVESGEALMEKKAAGLVGNEYLFDNSSIAKRILGRKIIKMVQKNYSVKRLQRLLSDQAAASNKEKQPLELTGEEGTKKFSEYSDEEIFEMLNTADLSEYDVQVGESTWNATNRRANFFAWAQMAQSVPGIPPSMLVELSDLPNKEAALKLINETEQQRQKEIEAKNQTEIAKTMIAQEGGAGGGAGEEPVQ